MNVRTNPYIYIYSFCGYTTNRISSPHCIRAAFLNLNVSSFGAAKKCVVDILQHVFQRFNNLVEIINESTLNAYVNMLDLVNIIFSILVKIIS